MMRYRLKFGNVDAFAAQKNRICVNGESAARLWLIILSIEHALSVEVWRRFCDPRVPNMLYR